MTIGDTWAERIAREIVRVEVAAIGFVNLFGLEARLRAYLDEAEQARLMRETREVFGEARVQDLTDAFFLRLPADVLLILTEDGFTVCPDDRARLRLDVEASIAAVTKRLN